MTNRVASVMALAYWYTWTIGIFIQKNKKEIMEFYEAKERERENICFCHCWTLSVVVFLLQVIFHWARCIRDPWLHGWTTKTMHRMYDIQYIYLSFWSQCFACVFFSFRFMYTTRSHKPKHTGRQLCFVRSFTSCCPDVHGAFCWAHT